MSCNRYGEPSLCFNAAEHRPAHGKRVERLRAAETLCGSDDGAAAALTAGNRGPEGVKRIVGLVVGPKPKRNAVVEKRLVWHGHLGTLRSSSPGELHPQALTDPDVNVSAHPAPTVEPLPDAACASAQRALEIG